MTITKKFRMNTPSDAEFIAKKLCKYDYQPVDGYIAVPDLPCIGNELTDYCFTNGKVTTIE